MPDTANEDTQAAGQPDASTDDAAAEQILAEAVQQPEQQADESRDDTPPKQRSTSKDPWGDPEAARKEIERLRKENASWRTKYREAEPQLAEYQKFLDSQKTEQQRIIEAKESAERELVDLRSANARLMAAATHNLPPELIDLLGSGTEEEIDARAKLLAEKLAATQPPVKEPPASTRPVESLTPGAKPAGQKPTDMDAILRAMSGRT